MDGPDPSAKVCLWGEGYHYSVHSDKECRKWSSFLQTSAMRTLRPLGQPQEAVQMRMDQTCHIRRLNSQWAQWYTPVTPAPGTLRQDYYEFKISLGYMSKSCLQKSKTNQTRTNTRHLGLEGRLRLSSKLFLQCGSSIHIRRLKTV